MAPALRLRPPPEVEDVSPARRLAAERAEFLQRTSGKHAYGKAERGVARGGGKGDKATRASSADGQVRTRVSADDETVSVKHQVPKSAVGEGNEVTVVTTVTHSKGGKASATVTHSKG